MNPEAAFLEAIQAAGLKPPKVIVPDGKLHRFSSNGKPKDDAGWYIFFGDEPAAGSFGDWRSGAKQNWRPTLDRPLSQEEESAHRARVEAMRRDRKADELRRRNESREKAAKIWSETKPAKKDHPYLDRKGIKPHRLRIQNGRLVVPMRSEGKIHSLQFIVPDGDKKFLTGGRTKGCYFSIGSIKGAEALCIAEGFATSASIHEATGRPVAVAFTAGNLLPVAKSLRDKFPELPLVICADDDVGTAGNPGLTKAREAARAVGGLLALPDFGAKRPEGATDFNDLSALLGLEKVRDVITSTLAAAQHEAEDGKYLDKSQTDVTNVTGVTSNKDGDYSVTTSDGAGVADVVTENFIPSENERPCFRVFDEWVSADGLKYRPGVWFFGLKAGKKIIPQLRQSNGCAPPSILKL